MKKKPVKKPAKKKAVLKPKKKSDLQAVLKKEDQILSQEKIIAKQEERMEKLEKHEVQLEQQVLSAEASEEKSVSNEMQNLERIEEEVKVQVADHPLKKVTTKDLIKGIIGAFVGVVVHFTFTYGVEIAEHISAARATMLLIITLVIGAGFLYGTGFRKVDTATIWWLLPYRIIVLYSVSILVTIGTLAFFYEHFLADPTLAFRQIAVVNLSAVIGACTADLIGRE